MIGAGQNSHVACMRVADIFLTLLPSMEELGLVAPGEFDPAAFAARMIADVTASRSVVIAWSEVAAWCCV